MNVLVTGGAGFIGSHLARDLLEDGHHVVLDNLDPYYDLGIKERNSEVCEEIDSGEYEFVKGSITNEELVADLFEEYDIEFVYHEAARAGVRTSVEQPKFYEENNVGGLLTLLEQPSTTTSPASSTPVPPRSTAGRTTSPTTRSTPTTRRAPTRSPN